MIAREIREKDCHVCGNGIENTNLEQRSALNVRLVEVFKESL